MGCVTEVGRIKLLILAALSIPYHGSWAVSPAGGGSCALTAPATFNTLPRVVGCVTWDRVLADRWYTARPLPQLHTLLNFQYPTTGRGLCHPTVVVAYDIDERLSIPYHGSWAVSHVRLQHRPLSSASFQYPTTGRGLCHDSGARRGRRAAQDGFQYPTTGRGLCHQSRSGTRPAPPSPFNTLPRVVGCVTAVDEDAREDGFAFNTLPRVVGCVTTPAIHDAGQGPSPFQYPTTGRGLCHRPRVPGGACQSADLSIPYHGSWAVSRRRDARRPVIVSLLSIPYHGSWAVSPRCCWSSASTAWRFQYPTTGRGLCHT